VLLSGAEMDVAPGEAVLINGPSGSGKSTLFRAIAGIWPFGSGTISLPQDARALFLPQRPYLPLGTLKRAVCYPEDEARFTDAEAVTALEEAGLGHLAPRLGDSDSWGQRLSGGEQQRLSFARAFLLRPDWLFLDEATASLDPEAEEEGDENESAQSANLASQLVRVRDDIITHLIRSAWARAESNLRPEIVREVDALEKLRLALARNIDPTLAIEVSCLRIAGLT
jgi:ABC-type transport system involved in cytochrome bd biosynthesis fused ATPase/permease subunit